jgi:signal transduction histidine kinase
MRDALAREPVDAVITDHNMPRFDSFASLQVAKSFDDELPVLVVSGEMSEDLAVATLHAGADDFVLKSRMFRLAAALLRSLDAADARRERKAALAALAASEAQLRELARHLETVKEEERRRIAREIHDDIGATLTALKFELARLARDLHPDEHTATDPAARMPAVMDLLAQAVAASHRIQHNLRPPVLDAGLVAALEWLVASFATQAGVKAHFESNREEATVAPDRAAAIYRVAQESLNNIARHARAARVNVQLFEAPGEVTLEVADDGVGFDARLLKATPGFGVRGLVERARGLGGWAEVNSAPGRGTTVMFSVPARPEDADASGAHPTGAAQ